MYEQFLVHIITSYESLNEIASLLTPESQSFDAGIKLLSLGAIANQHNKYYPSSHSSNS
jgi:hypothetical protein